MRELLGATATDAAVAHWGGIATAILMIGWGTGGILFGMMSDRYGRVKVMVLALMAYTIFSGVSGFSRSVTEFLIWRFLFGLGVGGMFGAATTLVAESVPPHFRTVALGSMQALSATGNIMASAMSLKLIPGQDNLWLHFSGWRVLFFAGVAPAILAIPMIFLLKEPEVWKKARQKAADGQAPKVGSMFDLFRHPRWRKSTLIGICFGVSGMVGLWGIGFFTPELITTAFKNRPLQPREIIQPAALVSALNSQSNAALARITSKLSPEFSQQLKPFGSAPQVSPELYAALVLELNRVIQEETIYDPAAFQGMTLKKSTQNLVRRVEKNGVKADVLTLNRQLLEQTFPGTIRELQKTVDRTRSRGTMLQDVGAFLGMFAFTFLAARFSRRAAFGISFVVCMAVVAFVFYSLKTEADAYWMLPLVGFATLSVFAGYSIYFPEIFPTRLRGTGVGFCYNTVRYIAAPFPALLGYLSGLMPFRTVAVLMCSIYLIGIVALIWAPETKGHPLPEE
jgi:MFS family permease